MYVVPYLANLLSLLLAPHAASPDQEYRVAQYAPRYRLAFTLLNEDAAAGQVIVGWDIPNALAREFSENLLPQLFELVLSRSHISDSGQSVYIAQLYHRESSTVPCAVGI
jgi:Phosphatidylinositol-glycan biosynthesis class S protein